MSTDHKPKFRLVIEQLQERPDGRYESPIELVSLRLHALDIDGVIRKAIEPFAPVLSNPPKRSDFPELFSDPWRPFSVGPVQRVGEGGM